jgi:hypothetical protein
MPGLLRGIARTVVVAGTATAVANRVSRCQANRWAQLDRKPETEMDDEVVMRLGQLRDLGELKSRGVLAEEEFDQQKNWILSQ